MSFERGDRVVLNSGGPMMFVDQVLRHGILCAWDQGGPKGPSRHLEVFPAACIRAVKRCERCGSLAVSPCPFCAEDDP